MRIEGIADSAGSEYAEVTTSGTAFYHIEVLAETCVCEHECSVAAYELQLSVCERVAKIEDKRVRHARARAVVHRSLAVVLACVLHTRNFPKPEGGAVELGAAQHLDKIRIVNINFPAVHQPLVKKPCN